MIRVFNFSLLVADITENMFGQVVFCRPRLAVFGIITNKLTTSQMCPYVLELNLQLIKLMF